ncbi:MAG: class I SAM-dependent methyltransferase [Treponema sp.]|jgi:23S rRNA G2069 N7-methylase RlmK/C1962 C5-methylase RlmI|nr:class I SAM-dependent methyltransferase [Treponema sp.]
MVKQNRSAVPGKDKTAAQAGMLGNRLLKRWRHLKKWARRTGTDAFRLYDRDIPEIPLALDFYGGAVAGALYKRPYEKDEKEEEAWLDAMAAAVSGALEIPRERIFIKERRRLKERPLDQYRRLGERNFIRTVGEGDLRFSVNLSDYLDTGLFLDRRKMRHLIREASAGKRVLNLFCYTAAFSVCAAAGGAASVDSVDMSRTYLEWGGRNFALNGFEASFPDAGTASPWRLIRSEAGAFLNRAERTKEKWDLVILDPPAFSNSKKMEGVLDIKRDHGKLIRRCLGLLGGGGVLWFSVNARGFRLEEIPGVQAVNREKELEDEDFKGRKLPACWTFQ